jgi:hypothetical protein
MQPLQTLRLSTTISFGLLLALFAVSASASAGRPHPPPLTVLYDSVISELHRGGTVVYFVPFLTTGVDQRDKPNWWKECPYSRMISAEGIEQARVVHRATHTLKLNIQFVESAESCTALSTKTYVVGQRWVRSFVTPDLNPPDVQRAAGLPRGAVPLHILSHFQTTIADSVKMLFGDTIPREYAPHPVLADLAEGESAIFRNNPDGELVLLARLNWRQWDEMASYYAATQRKKPSLKQPQPATAAAPKASN